MSTIDINSVAGFKAVDAEGNELGIMSMADITAAVKESIMQDAAMARSVATLSEASTLAATDTYEDQLPQQTDLKWARGLDANGNPILISKESLASVVGGLLPVESTDYNGLADKRYSRFYNYTGASDSLIKICSITKNGFSGRISLLFGRNEENKDFSLFNIYVHSWITTTTLAKISIIREHGSHNNMKFYKDESSLYAYCGDNYHSLSFHAEEIVTNSPNFSVVADYDIENLTEIPIQS